MAVSDTPADRWLREKSSSLDPESPVPLYAQIEELLETMVRRVDLQPGDRLPPEVELADRFGVSRETLRRAVDRLVRQGLLSREQGKGTFVDGKPLAGELPDLVSLTEEMASRGVELETRVLRREWLHPEPEVRAALNVPGDQRVLVLERLRLDGQRPFFYSLSYLPTRTGIDPVDSLDGSLYRLLREEKGIRPTRGEMVVRAEKATEIEARHLGMEAGEPVLRNRRLVFDQHDEPVEYVRCAFHPERYEHRLTIGETKGGAREGLDVQDETRVYEQL